jgi:hypothetical protein
MKKDIAWPPVALPEFKRRIVDEGPLRRLSLPYLGKPVVDENRFPHAGVPAEKDVRHFVTGADAEIAASRFLAKKLSHSTRTRKVRYTKPHTFNGALEASRGNQPGASNGLPAEPLAFGLMVEVKGHGNESSPKKRCSSERSFRDLG